MLKYKGYTAKIEIDYKYGLLMGEVLDLKDDIAFEAKTVEEAEGEFHRAVDAYLELCQKHGQPPEKPFSGKMPFRTTAEKHRNIYLAATQAGKSVNSWMDEVLDQAVQSLKSSHDLLQIDDGPSFSTPEARPISEFFEKNPEKYQALLDGFTDWLGISDMSERIDAGASALRLIEICDDLNYLSRKNDFVANDAQLLRDLVDKIVSLYQENVYPSNNEEQGPETEKKLRAVNKTF